MCCFEINYIKSFIGAINKKIKSSSFLAEKNLKKFKEHDKIIVWVGLWVGDFWEKIGAQRRGYAKKPLTFPYLFSR